MLGIFGAVFEHGSVERVERGFEPWVPGVTLFGLYFIGLVIAPLVAFALKRTLLRGDTPVFVTEGLGAATVQGSRAVRDWMQAQGYPITYTEVNADHGGMVPLVLPAVFDFFDAHR